MIDPKKWELVDSLMFWNPWSSVEFLAEMSGISASTVRRRLSQEGKFEAIEIPNQFGKNRKVFALKRSRQLSLLGLNMHPAFMAEALMMSFARLQSVRDLFSVLHRGGLQISWMISPWRPGHRGSMFDGLLKVATWDGGQMLLAVIHRNQDLNLLGYESLIKAWGRWRKKVPEHPAMLLLLDPGSSSGAVRRFQEVNDEVVCYRPRSDPEERWVYLTKDLKRTDIPPWGRGIGKPPAYFNELSVKTIHAGVRVTRHPHAESLAEWLISKNVTGIGQLTTSYLSLRPSEIEMFRWLALFPALDAATYVALNKFNAHSHNTIKKYKQLFKQTTNKLQRKGFVTKIMARSDQYALTPKGMLFFSLIVGLEAEEFSRSWGRPERVGKFSFQKSHQALVLRIIQHLCRGGNLVSAGTESNRLIYFDVRRAPKKLSRIEIRPDVIATLNLNHRLQTFWIEVDRGTRKGKKLRWKLEKLFYIFFARKKPGPIMPVLYVVACENGNHESRIRYILKLLKRLFALLPGTPLHLLITTADLLEQISGNFIEKPIWREFYLGKVQKRTRSLREIFFENKGESNQAN